MNQHYCGYCMHPLEAGQFICNNCGHSQDAPAPVHHLRVGTILRNKYLVGRALGEGGFGITYIGRDLTLDMKIAIKEYFPNGCANRSHEYSNEISIANTGRSGDYEKERQRFLSEARVLARFSNEPGVVCVRDYFQENGTAYIVMEYLDGITLSGYLDQYGPLPAEQLIWMLDPILQVLGDIHRQGLIHRDISPDNIMMLKNGRLKLLDFGAAREVTADKSLSVILKPGYAPEEQYRSKGQQGSWTDVYAMCATIYKCITGRTPDESMQRVFADELQPPSAYGVAIAPHQEATLMQGMRVKGAERIQTMEMLRAGFSTGAVFTDYSGANTVYSEPVSGANAGHQSNTVNYETPVYQGYPTPTDANTKMAYQEFAQPAEVKPSRKPSKGLPLPAILGIAGAAIAVLAVVLVTVFGGGKSGGKDSNVALAQINLAYTLSQVGTIQDPERDLEIRDDALWTEEGEAQKMLNYLGESKIDVTVSKTEYLGMGLYAVHSAGEDINSVGLVSAEGDVLIPFDACFIDWAPSLNGDAQRYLRVLYATDRTDVVEECFVYSSDDEWSVDGPKAGDIMYTGYGLVYDLQAKAFVKDVRFTNGDSYAVIPIGNTFAIEDEDGITKVYNADGEMLFQTGRSMEAGGGTFVVYDNGTYRVYDENGNQTYASNNGVYLVDGNNGYISRYEDGHYVIMDRNGNQVAGGVYESVYGENDHVFRVENNDKHGLVHADGTVIADCDKYTTSIYEIAFGVYYAYSSRNSSAFDLIGPDGVVATNVDSDVAYDLTGHDGKNAFVLKDADYTLELEGDYMKTLEIGLVAADSASDGLYGVFDLLSGTQLLDYEYEKVSIAAGYLYAFKNGEWEVYRINDPV